jgi:hypothetical protein
LLIYLVIVVGGGAVIATAAQMMFRPHLGGRMTGWILLWEELIGFALVFGGAIVMSRIERRPAGEYGLPASEMFDWGETFLYSVPNSGAIMHTFQMQCCKTGRNGWREERWGRRAAYFVFLVVMWLFPAKHGEPMAQRSILQN